MELKEIKDLTKFLTDEEVNDIKKQIRDKEDLFKKSDMDEGEMNEVLNTLFAILVIEKSLESEIDGIEDIRDELENELKEARKEYDGYLAMYKKEGKKKKKRWLLDFLMMSDNIHETRENIGGANKEISKLKKELNDVKQQKSEENLNRVIGGNDMDARRDFCRHPERCHNPHHHHHPEIGDMANDRRISKLINDINKGNITSRGNKTKETLPETGEGLKHDTSVIKNITK